MMVAPCARAASPGRIAAAPGGVAPVKNVRRETWHVQVSACASRPVTVMAFLRAKGFAYYKACGGTVARGHAACMQPAAALHISCNLNGVPGASRAERRSANPSNLIRIMPAEGA